MNLNDEVCLELSIFPCDFREITDSIVPYLAIFIFFPRYQLGSLSKYPCFLTSREEAKVELISVGDDNGIDTFQRNLFS